MSKEFMKVYHMPFKAQEIKYDNFTNFKLQFDQAFEEMTKSFSKQQDEIIINYLYEKYKDTKVSDVWVLSKPDFEKFLLEMLPKWKGKNTDIIDNYMAFKNDNANPSEALECLDKLAKQIELDEDTDYWEIRNAHKTVENALIKAQKEHNSLNLLMQELDCKDFAELRKYARCGYEKLNKQYLKWEDLEKDRTYKVLLNGIQYELVKRYDDYEYRCDYITLQKKPSVSIFIYEYEKEIFNDLHLERVEE